jgi:hypothetical protein
LTEAASKIAATSLSTSSTQISYFGRGEAPFTARPENEQSPTLRKAAMPRFKAKSGYLSSSNA